MTQQSKLDLVLTAIIKGTSERTGCNSGERRDINRLKKMVATNDPKEFKQATDAIVNLVGYCTWQ